MRASDVLRRRVLLMLASAGLPMPEDALLEGARLGLRVTLGDARAALLDCEAAGWCAGVTGPWGVTWTLTDAGRHAAREAR